jgi:hypothetical protein
LVLGGGGAAAFASSSSSPSTPAPASSTAPGAEAPESAATGPDTDNVQLQEGDQSGPDTPGAAEPAEVAGK